MANIKDDIFHQTPKTPFYWKSFNALEYAPSSIQFSKDICEVETIQHYSSQRFSII